MSEPKRVLAYPGQCRYCNKKRPVVGTRRFGGGTYRRPGRWYDTSICRECVLHLVPYIQNGHHQVSRYGASDIKRLAAAEWVVL